MSIEIKNNSINSLIFEVSSIAHLQVLPSGGFSETRRAKALYFGVWS